MRRFSVIRPAALSAGLVVLVLFGLVAGAAAASPSYAAEATLPKSVWVSGTVQFGAPDYQCIGAICGDVSSPATTWLYYNQTVSFATCKSPICLSGEFQQNVTYVSYSDHAAKFTAWDVCESGCGWITKNGSTASCGGFAVWVEGNINATTGFESGKIWFLSGTGCLAGYSGTGRIAETAQEGAQGIGQYRLTLREGGALSGLGSYMFFGALGHPPTPYDRGAFWTKVGGTILENSPAVYPLFDDGPTNVFGGALAITGTFAPQCGAESCFHGNWSSLFIGAAVGNGATHYAGELSTCVSVGAYTGPVLFFLSGVTQSSGALRFTFLVQNALGGLTGVWGFGTGSATAHQAAMGEISYTMSLFHPPSTTGGSCKAIGGVPG
jgi:hypothetical protein